MSNIKANSRVFKRYKIVQRIGDGGFSDVYKVEILNDPSLNPTQYALKYLTIKNSNDREGTLNRFKEEIKIMKTVNSRFFPKHIDSFFGEDEQYIVMEYFDGKNLRDLLKRNGLFNPETAVSYISQACEAIHELHLNNIVHRDIKTNNILVNKKNEIRILDFGLSIAPDTQRYTQITKVVGSVCYMAPELCKSTGEPSPKSDIYALGIMLYELLTGNYPIKGKDSQETLNKQSTQNVPRVTDFISAPVALSNVIIKATAKNPENRYKSALEMKMDLDTCLDKSRFYEKPLSSKTLKNKKTLTDIINSK
ncbi:UNVERIFIED_CONTAM: serine/threonine-protein kinase [Campylobacter lari]